MSDRFAGLGFDPAPGQPDDVRRCVRQHARMAAELDSLAEQITRAGEGPSSWRGAAAAAFQRALDPLPAQLRTAAQAFGATAARLSAWAAELDDLQVEARALERRASGALEAMRAGRAGTVGHSTTGAPATSALLGGGLHGGEIAEAQEQMRRATWAAHDVRARWRAGGRRAAAAVTDAAESAPPVPRSFGELVWQHRRGISTAADVSSVVSLPTGLIPAVGPPLAAGLGVASTAGRAALAAYADGSTTDVALAALGVGLGGASIVAVRAAGSPVAGTGLRSVARGAQSGDLGYAAASGATTVQKHSGGRSGPLAPAAGPAAAAPMATAPRTTSAPSPALRHLLVAPVTGEPSRKRP